jgi:ribonuclease HII
MRTSPDFSVEGALIARGILRVAGVDEAGRGPLCGPVVAAAVVLDPARLPVGLHDSKTLSAARREVLFDEILAAAEYGIALASVEEIDRLNILRASHLAMCRAVASLPRPPGHVLVDGNLVPTGVTLPCEAIVKGDTRCASVAAASILAKVTRDRIMVDLAQQFPAYGWDRNMGYPTQEHLVALKSHGITPHHRRSFRPVHNIL